LRASKPETKKGGVLWLRQPIGWEKPMKKQNRKTSRANLNLGDLIVAVSSCSRNRRETVAAVADLLESGRVRMMSGAVKVRARVI